MSTLGKHLSPTREKLEMVSNKSHTIWDKMKWYEKYSEWWGKRRGEQEIKKKRTNSKFTKKNVVLQCWHQGWFSFGLGNGNECIGKTNINGQRWRVGRGENAAPKQAAAFLHAPREDGDVGFLTHTMLRLMGSFENIKELNLCQNVRVRRCEGEE